MKIILSILNLLLISNILIAQGNIEGQIFSKSSENLTPLPGVNIYWLKMVDIDNNPKVMLIRVGKFSKSPKKSVI